MCYKYCSTQGNLNSNWVGSNHLPFTAWKQEERNRHRDRDKKTSGGFMIVLRSNSFIDSKYRITILKTLGKLSQGNSLEGWCTNFIKMTYLSIVNFFLFISNYCCKNYLALCNISWSPTHQVLILD